jgi:hypothetical protein
VATLSFGSLPGQCMGTGLLSVGGPYLAVIKSTLADGTTRTDQIKFMVK